MGGGELHNIFCRFASFGKSNIQEEIDNSKFYKFCKDCKLIDPGFTKTECDLTFAKAKASRERRLNFEKFCYALSMIADKKGLTNDQLVDKILSSRGPRVNATIADPVRFHDDINTYTGVYLNGGPTNLDRNNVTLETLLDRSPADLRGTNLAVHQLLNNSQALTRSGSRSYSRGESMNSINSTNSMMMTSPRNFHSGKTTTTNESQIIENLQQQILKQQEIIQQQQLHQQHQQLQLHQKQQGEQHVQEDSIVGKEEVKGVSEKQEGEVTESKTETKVKEKSNKSTNRKSMAPAFSSRRKKQETDDEDEDDDDDDDDDNQSTKSKASTKKNDAKKSNSMATRKSMAISSLRNKQKQVDTDTEEETDEEDEKDQDENNSKKKTNLRASIAPLKAKKRVTMAPTSVKSGKKGKGSDTEDESSDDEGTSSKSKSTKKNLKKVKKKDEGEDNDNDNDHDKDNDNEQEMERKEDSTALTNINGQGKGLLNAPDIGGLSLYDNPNYDSNETHFQYQQQQYLQYQHQQEMLKTRSNRSNSYPSSQYDQSLMSRELMHAVAEKFRAFATFGERVDASIDSFKFVKLLTDSGLLDAVRLNKQRADIIYYQAKKKGEKKMTFDEFRLKAVPLIAMTKQIPDLKVFEKIATCEGPKLNTGHFSNSTKKVTGPLLQDTSSSTSFSSSLQRQQKQQQSQYPSQQIQLQTSLTNTAYNNNNRTIGSGGGSRFDKLGNNTALSPPVGLSYTAPFMANNNNYAITGGGFNNSGMSEMLGGYSQTKSQVTKASPRRFKNKASIFDRLNDPKTFTGVYAKRFEQSEFRGRINDDTINYNEAQEYSGWTNTKKTDQKIEDLSQILVRR